MLPSMSCRILPPLLLSLLVLAEPAHAREMRARIAKITTPVATLSGVTVQLQWPADAGEGQLTLTARQVVAPDLGYRFDNLTWVCPLQRDAAQESWRCDGEVRSAGRAPLALSVDLATASTDAVLSKGTQPLPCIAARLPRISPASTSPACRWPGRRRCCRKPGPRRI